MLGCIQERLSRLLSQGHSFFRHYLMQMSSFTMLNRLLEKKKFVEVLEKTSGTIKEQLAVVAPALEKVLQQKEERVKEFFDVQSQIQKIHGEITGNLPHTETSAINETELSLKKLDEYQVQLQEL